MSTLLERLQNIGVQANTFSSTPAIVETKQKQRFEIPITRATIETQVAKQKGFEATRNKTLAERVKPFLTGIYQYPARTLTSFALDVAGKKELAQPKSTLAERVQRYLLGTDDIGTVKSYSERVVNRAKNIQETASQLGVKKEVPSFVAFGLSSVGLGGGAFLDTYLGGGKGKIAKELAEEAIQKLGKEQTEKILKEGGEKLLKEQIQSFDPLLTEARKYKSAEEFVNKYNKVEQFTETNKTGKFWANVGDADSGFGETRKEAFLDTSKLYKDNSSYDFVNESKTISEKNKKLVLDAFENGDGMSEYKVAQDIAEEELKKQGYKGVHWTSEDDLTPNQYQIWDKSIIKTKSQLTDIWNKAQGGADDLMTEARKYKSAEEFASSKIQVERFGKNNELKVGERGLFFSPKGTNLEGFGSTKSEAILNSRKMLKTSDQYSALEELIGKEKAEIFFDSLDDIVENHEMFIKLDEEVAKQAKKKGYDSLYYRNDRGNDPISGIQYVVLDKNIIKTKSQLTDIWNKANKTPTKVGAKQRGFITSVKEAFPELRVAGQYIPRSTDDLAIKAKNLIKENIDVAEAIALRGTDDKAIATAAELIKHYEGLKIYDKAAEIANVVAKTLTEQGRSIQAAAILGQQTPEGQLRFAARLIQKYNEDVTKDSGLLGLRKKIPELTAEQAKDLTTEYKRVIAMPDGNEKAMAFKKYSDKVASLVPSQFYKKAINLWKAGLLTGLKTTGLNTSANLFHGVSEIGKDIPASIVDSVVSLFTKKRTLALTTKGVGGGVKEGFEKGWRYLKTGYDERDVASKLDYRKVNFGNSKVAKALQTYEQSVFRLLGSEDQPFYYGAKARSLYSQAIAEAKNKKLKGQAQKEFIDKFVSSPDDKALKYATNDALMAVFQNQTLLGDVAKGLQKIPGGEIIVPFGRTPAAVAMQLLNYSPIGIVKTIVENVGKGKFDQRLFSQGIGRGLTGTAAMFIGVMAYKSDIISLDYPTDAKEQKQWELEGRKENSVKIGGKWRNINVLGPLGITMVVGGYYQRALEKTGNHSEALTQATIGGATALSEQTFLQGLNQFTDAIKDPEKYVPALTSRLLGSVVPTVVSDVARATDTLERRANIKEGVTAPFKSRLPGLRQTLEPKVDVMGNPLELSGNAIETMIDPTRPSRIKSSEVIIELRRLNDAGFISTPTGFADEKTYRDVLAPEEITSLQEKAGQILENKLENLFANKKYQALTDEEKQKVIQDFTSESRVVARAEMVETLLQGLSDQEKADKIVELKEKGFLSKSVFESWVELFDPQINASPTRKASTADDLQNSKDEKSLMDNLLLYTKAIGTDPATAFNRIFTNQRIRRIDNGTIIIERNTGTFGGDTGFSQGVRNELNATTELYLDHTIPVQLGGGDNKDNVKLVPKAVWESYTPIENYLGDLLRNEMITKKEAQELIQQFKNGQITEKEIYDYSDR